MRMPLIAAAGLLLAGMMPALAAEPDTMSIDALNANWSQLQSVVGNLRNSLIVLVQETVQLRQQVVMLKAQCGDKCTQPGPQAQDGQTPPAAPGPAAAAQTSGAGSSQPQTPAPASPQAPAAKH